MGKRVLLLGGTGAMGVHLKDILLERGGEVFITSRKQRLSNNPNLHYLFGNAKDNLFLESVLKNNYDYIVDFMVYSVAELANRIDRLLSSTKQYVFLSSARVYADSQFPITEDSPRLLDVYEDKSYTSLPEYAIIKAKQEDILQNSAYSNWTIIRPYITYNENRLQLGVMEKESWLYRALKGRTIIFSEDIAAHTTTMTYGRDVAQGIAAILGKEQAFGNIFHITQPQSLKWLDLQNIYLDTIESVIGRRPKIIHTPKAMNLAYPSLKWQVKVDRLYDRVFDNSKINKYIDTTSFVRPAEGLSNCLRIFLNEPHFEKINMFENMIMDKLSGDITSYSEFNSTIEYCHYLKWRWIDRTNKFLKWESKI